MSKLTRNTYKTFGLTAGGSDIGVFGSLAEGTPTYSNVINTIQSLNAWSTGWAAEITTIGTQPNCFALEDMNGFCHVISYGLNYVYQMGVPEYDAGTTYYQYSVCQYNGVLYQSKTDSNIGNTPAVGANWDILGYVNLVDIQTINGVKTFGTFPITPSAAPTLSYQVANKKYVDDNKYTMTVPTTVTDATESTTTSQSFQTKLTTTVTIGAGKNVLIIGEVDFSVPGQQAGSFLSGEVCLSIGGAQDQTSANEGTYDTSTFPRHGYHTVVVHSVRTDLSGSTVFALQYRAVTGSTTVKVKNARLSIIQL